MNPPAVSPAAVPILLSLLCGFALRVTAAYGLCILGSMHHDHDHR